ncbi:hypothetical protein UFOVP116_47 [uncultured Caudovirales phage]|uniref:Uncharacterized protein n=1 Tax=uncultured Caudovirales phage TaxID=2100421 RepID=A0A6J5L5A0_9CAUD|nr:hypothetical protein UFOVP116_47 [uncultured Caudovirales phage]
MDYKSFHRVFLEIPQRVNGGNPYSAISQAIDVTLEYDPTIKSLGNSVYQAGDYFWSGSADAQVKQISVATSLVGDILKVNAIGKDPALTNQPPYAIDLYLTISCTLKHGIKFGSDQILSDSGFELWKRIFDSGHNLLIYNAAQEKYEPIVLKTAEDLKQYFSGDQSAMDYQYVIAEGAGMGNLRGSFQIMEWKRLAGYPLKKLFGKT